MPTALAVGLERLAGAAPDRVAVSDPQRSLTRREFDLRTNRLARAYAELGVKQDSMITIALPNGVEFFEATIAAWKLGATPQPLSARMPAAEQAGIIELAAPALVVGLEAAGRTSVPDGFEPDPGLSDEPLPPAVASSWKALASGGSTGRPKLIVASAPAVLEGAAYFAQLIGMEPDRTQLVTGPLYHNGPFLFGMVGLLTGNRQVVMPRFDASTALQMVGEHEVDWMYAVPTMMHRIWRLPEAEREAADVSSLRLVVHMGAPCAPWLKQAWIDWLGPEKIGELYGGTEGLAASVINGTEWLEHRGSVGKAVLGEFTILDAERRPVAPGVVGEVWMRPPDGGPANYRYIGAEARTYDGWESLGEYGWMDADGYLYLADRESDMILVGGSNVYPAEVEGALEEHPQVQSSCVIGLPDDDLGNRVHAIVQVEGEVSDAELLTHLQDRLASYKHPRSFERVPAPLRDAAGKIRRSALRAERIQLQAITEE